MTSIFTRFPIQSTDNCISANVDCVVSFDQIDLSIKSFTAAVIARSLIYWGRVPLFQLTDGLSPFCISKQIGQFSLLLQISTLHMHSVWFRKTDPYSSSLFLIYIARVQNCLEITTFNSFLGCGHGHWSRLRSVWKCPELLNR